MAVKSCDGFCRRGILQDKGQLVHRKGEHAEEVIRDRICRGRGAVLASELPRSDAVRQAESAKQVWYLYRCKSHSSSIQRLARCMYITGFLNDRRDCIHNSVEPMRSVSDVRRPLR